MAFILYGGRMKKLILLLSLVVTANAQNYPYWFLFQDQVNCKTKIVTVLRSPSLHRDEAIESAFQIGCDLLAKYVNVKIHGGQAFWTTEAGVHSMGAHYEEQYDSTLAELYQEKLKVLDVFIDKQKLIVLTGDSSACLMDEKLKITISIKNVKQPRWVEDLPDDRQYFYGVGSSEDYYYEASSWERAEHNAYMSLARTVRSTVQSLQKKDVIESQDVFNEDIDVNLQDIDIVARWRDVKKKIFFVLARVKR